MLQKIRRIEFRFPRRDATYALSAFALIYFFAFQFYSNDIFSFLKKTASAFEGGEVAERMILAVVSLLPFIILLLVRGQPLKSMGWSKENLRAGLTVGIMLVVLTIFLRGKFLALLNGISAKEGSLLLVILVLCLAEETIFRGYIHLRMTSFLGSTWGWLATAGLYLLWQLPGRLWLQPFSEIWPEILIPEITGLLLGWIMRKTGHVTAPVLFRAFATWLVLQ